MSVGFITSLWQGVKKFVGDMEKFYSPDPELPPLENYTTKSTPEKDRLVEKWVLQGLIEPSQAAAVKSFLQQPMNVWTLKDRMKIQRLQAGLKPTKRPKWIVPAGIGVGLLLALGLFARTRR